MRAVCTSRRYSLRTLKCLLMILTLIPCAYGQSRERHGLTAVPEPLRARLIERLNNYVEYQRTKEYGKFYDLLTEPTIARIYRGQSRVEFIESQQKAEAQGTISRLLEFVPTSSLNLTDDVGDYFEIFGRAKLCKSGELVRRNVGVEARLIDGEWYFSTTGEVIDN
jgi:hypothetical protein